MRWSSFATHGRAKETEEYGRKFDADLTSWVRVIADTKLFEDKKVRLF